MCPIFMPIDTSESDRFLCLYLAIAFQNDCYKELLQILKLIVYDYILMVDWFVFKSNTTGNNLIMLRTLSRKHFGIFSIQLSRSSSSYKLSWAKLLVIIETPAMGHDSVSSNFMLSTTSLGRLLLTIELL